MFRNGTLTIRGARHTLFLVALLGALSSHPSLAREVTARGSRSALGSQHLTKSAETRAAVDDPVVQWRIDRLIPLRFVILLDNNCMSRPAPLCGSTCLKSSTDVPNSDIRLSVERANEVYASAGLQFWVRSIVRVQAPYH